MKKNWRSKISLDCPFNTWWLWYHLSFSLHLHNVFLNIAQQIWVLLNSNPLGGYSRQYFSSTSVGVYFDVLPPQVPVWAGRHGASWPAGGGVRPPGHDVSPAQAGQQHPHPPKMDVLPKTFLQIILASKSPALLSIQVHPQPNSGDLFFPSVRFLFP